MGNMYGDSVKQWNVFKGCEFKCSYCIPSFQRQAKRQKHRCMDCYNYVPHFHEERLKETLPKTTGDQFIWVGSSGDISFCKEEWMNKILDKIKYYPDRTFFFQTKDPRVFEDYRWTDNILLGITLETNRTRYKDLSKAPSPRLRAKMFESIKHTHKVLTIEPILNFDHDLFIKMIKKINPERIYIGYDTKKCHLPEPSLSKTRFFIKELRRLGFVVKEKLLRERWNEE